MNNSTLSNVLYDRIKRLTQIALPATGSLYFGLSQIWGFPAGEQVVGTIALFTTFFGVVLGVSNKNYNNQEGSGEIVISHTEEGGKLFSLQLDGDPDNLMHKQKVVFKVVDEDDKFWERPYNLDRPDA